MEIDQSTWNELRCSVIKDNLLSLNFLDRYFWKAVIFDDNALDFSMLEQALLKLDVAEYYCVPVVDLKMSSVEARILKIVVGSKDWQKFMEFDENDFSANLEDCVFFSSPLKFLVLRTGFVEHTIYAGTDEFLLPATSVDLGEERVIAIGEHWPKSSVFDYYDPMHLTLGKA